MNDGTNICLLLLLIPMNEIIRISCIIDHICDHNNISVNIDIFAILLCQIFTTLIPVTFLELVFAVMLVMVIVALVIVALVIVALVISAAVLMVVRVVEVVVVGVLI